MRSNAGPWNDYVVINKRIKHKAEIAQEEAEEEQKRQREQEEALNALSDNSYPMIIEEEKKDYVPRGDAKVSNL